MRKNCWLFILLFSIVAAACNNTTQSRAGDTDKNFTSFEASFLDAYWKQYPTNSIFIGYGKYYDNLVIPDSIAVANNLAFSRQWADSLNRQGSKLLNDNNKISFNIIKNQLESDTWYQSVFKSQEWDPSQYNLSGECYYIITQPFAGLDERLRILSKHLEKADSYYQAAFKILKHPTKEHTELSVMQNEGGLSVFGAGLTDSIKISHLSDAEKNTLNVNITKTVTAVKGFVDSLKEILSNKNYVFRSFRIGKKLFDEKFKYDLATDLTPEALYNKAVADKQFYYNRMFHTAYSLWNKYYTASKLKTHWHSSSLFLIKYHCSMPTRRIFLIR